MPTDYSQNGKARNARHLARELETETEQARADRALEITVGFTFSHPTQGTCRVISTPGADRVRYSFGTPGWPPRYAVTTRTAIGSLIDAGVLAAL